MILLIRKEFNLILSMIFKILLKYEFYRIEIEQKQVKI